MLSRPRVRLRRAAAWAATVVDEHGGAPRNYDGADWRELLAGETRTFPDEIPWSVAGIFSKFGTMNESESSLMLRIRNRSRGVLYRSQPTDTIGGAGC